MKRHWKKIGIIVVSLFLAINATMVVAYAYFESQQAYGIEIHAGEVDMIAHISFNGLSVDINSPYYDVSTHTILVNMDDTTSENYITKLKVDLEFTPEISSRMRIKIMDVYELTRTYEPREGIDPISPLIENINVTAKPDGYHPFSFLLYGDNYHPIFDQNGYEYWPDILRANQQMVIHLIDGGMGYPVRQNEIYHENCLLRLRLSIEVVQANRFPEIWSLDPGFFNQ